VAIELTTVADDLVVFHDGDAVHRYEGLEPDTDYVLHGVAVRTLPRPPGERLATVATVNDVHFGELECGRIDDHEIGPILRAEPGEPPYPETMSRAAVAEIAAADPDAVIVKGDLTTAGHADEFAAFEDCYRTPFGDRLFVTRGNHDAYQGQSTYAGDAWGDVAGCSVGLLDTVKPFETNGTLDTDQLTALDDGLGERADRRVILLGHHQQWIGTNRSPDYFGLDPDASDALDALCVRHPNVVAYAAGHTHRHRRRTMTASGATSIEVGCVKDFPGTWAEYRVFEGGVLQVVHRISSPEALSWSNRCRVLYSDFGVDYQAYAFGDLADRCFALADR